MINLPADFELIGFFECEPEVASPEVPWCYNRLRFETARGDSLLICEIEPAFGEFCFSWYEGGNQRANLKLNEVSNLSVYIAKDDEYLMLSSVGEFPEKVVKIRYKPFISIELSCWNELR